MQTHAQDFNLEAYDHTDYRAHENTRHFEAAQLQFKVKYVSAQTASRSAKDTTSKKISLIVTDLRTGLRVTNTGHVVLSAPPSHARGCVTLESFIVRHYSNDPAEMTEMELRILSCFDEYYGTRSVHIKIDDSIPHRDVRARSPRSILEDYLGLTLRTRPVGGPLYIRLDGKIK